MTARQTALRTSPYSGSVSEQDGRGKPQESHAHFGNVITTMPCRSRPDLTPDRALPSFDARPQAQ
jgi:hypothetical protein